MFGSELDVLLQKSLDRFPVLLCARSLKHDIDELAKPLLPAGRAAVVFDKNTGEALGERVSQALNAAQVRLPGIPLAEMARVEQVRRQSAGCTALVAVGSGTINDICKYAAFADNKPYIVFPTAASMNGYGSANASITVNGYKTTLPARMPIGVFCDLSVIAGAPVRLSRSGLGDSLARPTAQADWLLSHLLLSTPYTDVAFALLRPLEPQLFAQARGIGKGDTGSIELLMKLLLLSGFGMTIAGGSYPASQGEHMIAHSYEMAAHHAARSAPATLHGEEIGVTTLYMAALQEKLLRGRPALQPDSFREEMLASLFGNKVAAEAKKSYSKKQNNISIPVVAERLHHDWENIAEQIRQVHLSASCLANILKEADAPGAPEELGWDKELYAAATAHARFMRDRFTFLDLM